jgi:hypothetical protein
MVRSGQIRWREAVLDHGEKGTEPMTMSETNVVTEKALAPLQNRIMY